MRRFYRQAFQRDLALGALAAASPRSKVARRLRETGVLKGSIAVRYGRCLLRLGLFSEALELLESDDSTPDGERMWQGAVALAGVGRTGDACARLEAAPRM